MTPLGVERESVGPPAEQADKRRRILMSASAVVVLAVLAAVALALNVFGGNDEPTSAAAGEQTSSAPADSLPPDEQCTPEIMSNPHWVCLTSAIVADGKITIDYRSDGAKFNLHGVHLHIYGGDGTAPQARIMGRQVPESEQGNWYNESHRPAVLPVDDERFISSIGDARKVCARIGDAKHMLVPDENGTYVTGNCVPITRTGSATTTAPPDGDNGGNGNGNNAPDTWDPTTTQPTTTTPPTTTEDVTTEDVPSVPAP